MVECGKRQNKMLKKLNKKASIQDLVFMGVVLLFFGMIVLFGFKVTDSFNDKIQDMDAIPSNGKAASSSLTSNFSGVIDNTFLLLTIGLTIAALILASLVRVHPIFIPFFWISLLFVIFICGILSNIYQETAATEQLAPLAEQLTFISHILEYLPLIVGIVGHILMVVMYKLWSNAQI